MNKLIIASNNKHKISEFKQILSDYELYSMSDIGYNDEIVETGKTAFENALIKAKTVSEFLVKKGINIPVIADDSGLYVNALNGEPGIYSARYAGIHGNDEANRKLLLNNLKNKQDRSAFFLCIIVKYYPNHSYIYGEGKSYGSILKKETGDNSFGYDCLFFSSELNKCFGEASHEEKNSISHRGKAITDLINKEKNG